MSKQVVSCPSRFDLKLFLQLSPCPAAIHPSIRLQTGQDVQKLRGEKRERIQCIRYGIQFVISCLELMSAPANESQSELAGMKK